MCRSRSSSVSCDIRVVIGKEEVKHQLERIHFSKNLPIPDNNSAFIVFTESTSSGNRTVMTTLEPSTLVYNDANWCASLAAQTWKFSFASNGIDSKNKNFYIVSQNTGLSGGRYLTYNSSNATTKLGWSPTDNSLFTLTSMENSPVRTASFNSAEFLAVYRIKNVASGLSLTYQGASTYAPYLTTTDNSLATQLFSFYRYKSC